MTQCVECLSTGAGSCSFCSLDSLCHNSSSWGPTSPGDSHSFVRRHRIRHRLLLVRVRDAEGKLLESAHGPGPEEGGDGCGGGVQSYVSHQGLLDPTRRSCGKVSPMSRRSSSQLLSTSTPRTESL